MDFIISIPGHILRFCNDLVGNQYVLALLIFALLIEIVLLPFGIKQQKNSIKQAKMRPKEMAIRKKYEGRTDRETQQKMSMEIQEMYQKEGFNPMSGCLPMLIQFPIIIALYNIVMNPLKYICGLSTDAINSVMGVVNSFPQYADVHFTAERNIDLMSAVKNIISTNGVDAFKGVEGFTDKIGSINDIPNLSMFGGAIDLADTPSITAFNWLLLVPILTFVSYFLSMKITRKLTYQPAQNDASMGCSMKIMDYAMPLMSVFIAFQVPAALGVYWIFKSIIGVVKQAILYACMPLPKFTDEELKKAEKEYKETAPKVAERQPSATPVRSLHHIDDEDYEDGVLKTPQKAAPKKEVKEETPAEEVKENKLLGKAPLKEEEPRKKKKNKKEDKEDNK